MNILEKTYLLSGERLLTPFDSQSMVDWAVAIIGSGYDSESLWILAELNHDSTEV